MHKSIKRRQFLKSSLSLGIFSLIPSALLKASNLSLPNVLIIGDSISMGYTPFVRQILAEKANVTHPTENCGPTERGVANLEIWLDQKKYEVIYFNFGLHDLKHVNAVTKAASNKATDPVLADIPTYAANLDIIAKKLKQASKRVIFATTTPVPAKSGSPLREPAMPEKYNEAARVVMKKNNIPVDDLYHFVLPQIASIQRPNNVHYTPAGYEILAKRVAETITKNL
jgi:hypothetical protein